MAEANGWEAEWEKFCKEKADSFDRYSALQRSGIAGVFEIEGKKFIRKARLAGFDEAVKVALHEKDGSRIINANNIDLIQKLDEKRTELSSGEEKA